MKKLKWWQWLMAVIIVPYILFIGIYLSQEAMSLYTAKKSATIFFNKLVEGEYEEARIFTSYNEDWIKKISEVRDIGFYPVSYSNLNVKFDDGCVCAGSVDLTFMENGQKTNYQDVIFSLQNEKKIGQVCIFKEEHNPKTWDTVNCHY